MTNQESELRAELERMKAAVRAASETSPKPVETAPDEAAPDPAPKAQPPADFEELIDALRRDVEELHPMTALAIFGLGVLTGRLLTN